MQVINSEFLRYRFGDRSQNLIRPAVGSEVDRLVPVGSISEAEPTIRCPMPSDVVMTIPFNVECGRIATRANLGHAIGTPKIRDATKDQIKSARQIRDQLVLGLTA